MPPASPIGENKKGLISPRTEPSRASAATPTISYDSGLAAAGGGQAPADRALAGQILAGERLVDDHRHRTRGIAVAWLELAAVEQPRAHRPEELRGDREAERLSRPASRYSRRCPTTSL